MGMSISLKKDTRKTNIKHNNRKMTDKEKEQNSHIDFSRSNENNYLVSKSLKELYKTEFGQAQKDYNDKQKRADRKIHNYYDHVQKGKKTSLQQEMILQVGDKDDFNDNPENRKLANEVLEEWFHKFEERNPNLKVYNAVIHNDEASPHMHLNFVPVATGYKRGMDKQVSFDKAILQQDHTLNKERPFDDWRNKEVLLLEKMLKERGIERDLIGTNDFKDVNDLKEKKDQLRELEMQTAEVKQQFEEVQEKLQKTEKVLELKENEKAVFDEKLVDVEQKLKTKQEKLKKTTNDLVLKEMKAEFLDEQITENEQKLEKRRETLQKDVQGLLKAVEVSKSVENIQVEKGGVFDRKSVKLSAEDFDGIKTLAKASEAFKTQNEKLERQLTFTKQEKEQLKTQNSTLKSENQELKEKNTGLAAKITRLEMSVNYLKETLELIKKNSEIVLGVARERMQYYVGLARGRALKSELGKEFSSKDLLTLTPEDEKVGASKSFEQVDRHEKERAAERSKQRRPPELER